LPTVASLSCWSNFRLKIAPDSIDAIRGKGGWGHILIGGFVMGIGYPPHKKQDRLEEFRGAGHADNVLPLREENALLQGVESPHRGDEFFDILSPLLEASAEQEDESPHQESNEFLLLLEENARLRKLAVQLSNLLGDLPERTAREVERLSVVDHQSKAS
jgi:hypothetical protein